MTPDTPTPEVRRLSALRTEVTALTEAIADEAAWPILHTLGERVEDQADLALQAAMLAELPDPDAGPVAEVTVPTGTETAPPQVVRLDVTGCAGADRLIVVVDLGMGSPNGRAGDGRLEALQAARVLLGETEVDGLRLADLA